MIKVEFVDFCHIVEVFEVVNSMKTTIFEKLYVFIANLKKVFCNFEPKILFRRNDIIIVGNWRRCKG